MLSTPSLPVPASSGVGYFKWPLFSKVSRLAFRVWSSDLLLIGNNGPLKFKRLTSHKWFRDYSLLPSCAVSLTRLPSLTLSEVEILQSWDIGGGGMFTTMKRQASVPKNLYSKCLHQEKQWRDKRERKEEVRIGRVYYFPHYQYVDGN